MNVKHIPITINIHAMERLLKNNYIQDYTDDGFVLTIEAGWIPAGDVLEDMIYSEVLYEEETKGTKDQDRSSTP